MPSFSNTKSNRFYTSNSNNIPLRWFSILIIKILIVLQTCLVSTLFAMLGVLIARRLRFSPSGFFENGRDSVSAIPLTRPRIKRVTQHLLLLTPLLQMCSKSAYLTWITLRSGDSCTGTKIKQVSRWPNLFGKKVRHTVFKERILVIFNHHNVTGARCWLFVRWLGWTRFIEGCPLSKFAKKYSYPSIRLVIYKST